MTDAHFAVTAGWGVAGQVMLSCLVRAASWNVPTHRRNSPFWRTRCPCPVKTTFGIHLNEESVWCNIPAAIWNYRLGGYQVLKK